MHKKIPILIVDDNATNLKLVAYILTGQGYDVNTATDIESASRAIQTQRPQLVLMDLQLPDGDGLELTRRLKAARETRDIIVLAVTAFAMKGDEDRALAAGCDGYIAKPIDTRALQRTVAEYLAGIATPERS
jgi:two-component system, cell cycle response regulator DivK